MGGGGVGAGELGGDHGTVTLGVRLVVRRTAGEGAWDLLAVAGARRDRW